MTILLNTVEILLNLLPEKINQAMTGDIRNKSACIGNLKTVGKDPKRPPRHENFSDNKRHVFCGGATTRANQYDAWYKKNPSLDIWWDWFQSCSTD